MDGATALLRFSAHIGVVGGRVGTGEAMQIYVEMSAVQILVVVANSDENSEDRRGEGFFCIGYLRRLAGT